jgi:hypothetical protein
MHCKQFADLCVGDNDSCSCTCGFCLEIACERLRARVAELEAERRAAVASLENVIDSSKDGGWIARALDAERERDRMRPVVDAAVSLARDKGALFDVEEAVDEYLACKLPPAGWSCSRGYGHDGPCAASPVTP